MNPTAVRMLILCKIDNIQYCMAYIDKYSGKFILPGGKLLEYGDECVEIKENAVARYMITYFGEDYSRYNYEWGKYLIDSTYCIIINGNALLSNGTFLWRSIMRNNTGLELQYPLFPYPLDKDFGILPSEVQEYHYPGLYVQSVLVIPDPIRIIILENYGLRLTHYPIFEQRYIYLGNMLSRILNQLKRSLK